MTSLVEIIFVRPEQDRPKKVSLLPLVSLHSTRDLDRIQLCVLREGEATSHMESKECAAGTKAFLHPFIPQ
jgi:hypothetical protein